MCISQIIGEMCLLAAFVASGYAAIAASAGDRAQRPRLLKSGLLAGIGATVLLSVVLAILAFALVTKDFRFAYVASY
ncbi:MAG: hypothetical protein KDA42_17120, partial [Planctomycetales bacterium]|nr:hypothetical protein [Planctomycetales bacterium]